MTTPRLEKHRAWLVAWCSAAAIGHLVVGLVLTLGASWAVFDPYHAIVEARFWADIAPQAARVQQQWWMALFGATVQLLAFWMWMLVRVAAKARNSSLWSGLAGGLLLWAPQDMLISARAGVWLHVWVDLAALALMLPPLIALWRIDRRWPLDGSIESRSGQDNHKPAQAA